MFNELTLQALHPVSKNTLMYEIYIESVLNSTWNVANKRGVDFDT